MEPHKTTRENIERFKEQIAHSTDPAQANKLRARLAKERQKLLSQLPLK
ncbi:MAG TPA: hypothetical protein VF440_04720 [Novosphingobium sp.]